MSRPSESRGVPARNPFCGFSAQWETRNSSDDIARRFIKLFPAGLNLLTSRVGVNKLSPRRRKFGGSINRTIDALGYRDALFHVSRLINRRLITVIDEQEGPLIRHRDYRTKINAAIISIERQLIVRSPASGDISPDYYYKNILFIVFDIKIIHTDSNIWCKR